MNLRHVVIAGAALLLPCAVADVRACQCRERQPPCAQYVEADAVFAGLVADIATPEAAGPDGDDNGFQKISFKVERAFRGVEGGRAELINRGTSCDYTFEVGTRYLVYAYRNPATGKLGTGYCSRTAELSKAAVDLDYLDRLAALAPEKLITGVLADGQKRLGGVRVTAESGGRLYRSTSNQAGWFKLSVSKPGEYRVRIFLPKNVGVGGTLELLDKISGVVKTSRHYVVEYVVAVRAGGCAFIDVPLFIFASEAYK